LSQFSSKQKVHLNLYIWIFIALLIISVAILIFTQINPLSVGKSLNTKSRDEDSSCSTQAEIDMVNLVDMGINQDITDTSSHIIIGDVKGVESRWNNDETFIYTYVTISLKDCLKGDLESEEVTIKVLGGEVGEIGLLVSNQSSFVIGEKVKVFLKREGTDEFNLIEKISYNSETPSGYSYLGIHWHSSDLPVEYYINELGTSDTTSEFIAIQSSFQTWENDPGSYMDYTYRGTTHRIGKVQDSYNVVTWGSIDGPGGILAQTIFWYDTRTKLISEFDLIFDDAETWSTTGESGKYDVQNIGTHEAGHTLNLEDLYDSQYSEETMYGYANSGETKKITLNAGDIAGIHHIYGNLMVTYTISTEPEGLQINVDGVNYTAPNSFNWDIDSTHVIEALSPQSGDVNIRYIYESWDDGGARVHSINVGESNNAIVARFTLQYSIEFSVITFGQFHTNLTNYVTVTYIANEESNNADIWDNFPVTVWCDSQSTAKYSNPSSGSTPNHRWYCFENTSLTITRSEKMTLTYYEQILTSYIFEDLHGRTIVPTSISTEDPYLEDDTFTTYSNLWLNFGVWTIKEILWEGADVKPETGLSFNVNSSKVWAIKCAIYDFEIKVTDLFSLPISEANVSVILPNGTIVETQTNTYGQAVISQVTKGQYTAVITYMKQTIKVSGDITQVAGIPAQAKIYFSIPVIISLFIIIPISVISIILVRRRRNRA